MDLDKLTIGEAKAIAAMFAAQTANPDAQHLPNPFIGQCVLVRTYSAGVHAGTLVSAQGRECVLHNGIRIWRWKGSLSLSGVARQGITGGRTQRTHPVMLTEAIEYHMVSDEAWKSYEQFAE